jgi:hypothetical protein
MLRAMSLDVDVVVNLRARRGSRAVAEKCRRELPGARVLTSRSMDEAARFAREASRDGLLVSAGGDGTALALLNTLRRDVTRLGVLPLGTGNAWAHAMEAPGWRIAVERLGLAVARGGALPMRRFELVEVELPGGGPTTIAHFAGTGWDAEIIDDFHQQKTAPGVLPRAWRDGIAGYFQGLLLRTIPRHLAAGAPPEVELVNEGSDALTVDDEGRAVPLRGGEHGKVLYRGPTNVCAAGTAPTWGFGFRAFPFAGLVPGRICLRTYGGRAGEATLNMRRLWLGTHPMPKMSTFLVDRVRARFSRPVPFQAGGDRLGHRDEIVYALAREQVDLVDWRRLATA